MQESTTGHRVRQKDEDVPETLKETSAQKRMPTQEMSH